MEDKVVQSPFEYLGQDIQAKLRSIMREKLFRIGEQFFAQGVPASAFYFVVSGRVKIMRLTPDGHGIILCMPGPGDCFCPVSIVDGGPQLGIAQAVTEVKVLWAGRAECLALFKESPLLLSLIQATCLGEVRRLVKRLELLTYRSLKQRLAVVLLDQSLCQQTSCITSDELRITQQELAELVGVSRESVSRLLAQWEREGKVLLKRGRVLIQRRNQLERLVGE